MTSSSGIRCVAIKYRTFSSKDVKHIGLKSMIANQILRKFGNQRKARSVKNVKMIIPNQGIKLSKGSTTIEIPCLKCSFQYRFPSFEKVNQIEIGKEYVYMSHLAKIGFDNSKGLACISPLSIRIPVVLETLPIILKVGFKLNIGLYHTGHPSILLHLSESKAVEFS
jgi:hypothetical protein